MDLILEEKDAADWVYRGEGAANIVLAYTGSIPTLVGKVLRIQKAPENETHCSNGSLSFSKHELLLWKDFDELVRSPTKEVAAQQYAQHVIGPLLGSKHVDAGIRVLVSREFLEEIQRNIKSHRPDWRIDAAMVDTLKESALLISDHSLFPHGILKGNVSISVEIKIPNLSKYDPLDLFSGSKGRIHEALKALCNNPQNNFRVFLNGSLILGGFGGVADNSTSVTAEALEDVLKYVIEADDGLRTTSFLELLTETVYKSGVLDRLLDVQKLDNYDVEGAIHAYYNFISQPCSVCGELGVDEVSPRATFLHALPPNESLEIVKKFLIAATAKDCSLMFCFRRREDSGSDSSYDGVYLESTNQVFDYKVHFIDLDLKPLEKMEHYFELDKKIVSTYTEALQNGRGTENDHTIKLYESTQ